MLKYRTKTHQPYKHTNLRNDLRSSLKPMYIDRFVYLVLVVTLNFVAAILGVVFTPSDFPSFLLAVFLLNLMVYLIYYLIMKFIHGEV